MRDHIKQQIMAEVSIFQEEKEVAVFYINERALASRIENGLICGQQSRKVFHYDVYPAVCSAINACINNGYIAGESLLKSVPKPKKEVEKKAQSNDTYWQTRCELAEAMLKSSSKNRDERRTAYQNFIKNETH